MIPTVRTVLDDLRRLAGSDAAAGRLIGISRAALFLARDRRRLADSATIKAAAALALPPAFLLAAMHADMAHDATARACWLEAAVTLAPSAALYYVKSQGGKNEQQTKNDEKPDNGFQSKNNVHRITPMSEKEELARLVLQWCLVVARIAPDSPRLALYVSRWNVPGKIADASAAGTLADTLAGCPPIDRKHLPAGIAAVAAWHDYQQPPMLPDTEESRLQARQSASAA